MDDTPAGQAAVAASGRTGPRRLHRATGPGSGADAGAAVMASPARVASSRRLLPAQPVDPQFAERFMNELTENDRKVPPRRRRVARGRRAGAARVGVPVGVMTGARRARPGLPAPGARGRRRCATGPGRPVRRGTASCPARGC
ncbi:hypothetical protein [Burkholderia plantarii]|uniref:hypothetical protein n=1 Tax=Burkholderia plantarii TaxID=41899 RepID=UPI00114C961A|nr:hypothetical protein [Burkholderia plantarii]